MNTSEGVSLNLRGTPPALREALRDLAKDADQALYRYVLNILQQHVKAYQGRTCEEVTGTPSPCGR